MSNIKIGNTVVRGVTGIVAENADAPGTYVVFSTETYASGNGILIENGIVNVDVAGASEGDLLSVDSLGNVEWAGPLTSAEISAIINSLS